MVTLVDIAITISTHSAATNNVHPELVKPKFTR